MSSALYYLFKKTAFIILVSLAAVSVFSAELKTKIAVCGYEPLADILTTKLSENDRFDMLERSQISRVLKEQKINAQLMQKSSLGKCFPHADIFVILSSAAEKNRECPSGIVIFNAKNGAQLVNEALPKDLSRAVEASLKAVNSANEKLNSGKLHAVSISAVRDTGVSKDERYKIAETASLIERGIGASSDIQILERSHLERVVKERTVTDKELPLDASALFIRLEYIPDANRKSTDLRITLTDVERKVLFSYEIKDCFLSPVKTSGAAVEKICGFLKINPPQKLIDSKKEAARFYAEYQNLTANGVAKKDASPYLFASLAIDHNSFEARKAELFYYAEFLGDMQWNERIPALWETLDNMKLFIRDFPDAHKHQGASIHTVIGSSTFLKNLANATPEQLQRLDEYADAYRAFHFETCGKYYAFDLSHGINTLDGVKSYCMFVNAHQDYYLFCTPYSWYWKRYRMNLDALRLADSFSREHPECREELDKHILTASLLFTRPLLSRWEGQFQYDREVALKYFSDLREYEEFAENSVLGNAKVFAAEARCFRNIANSDLRKDTVNGLLINFFEEVYAMAPDTIDYRNREDKSYKYSPGYLLDFLRNVTRTIEYDTASNTLLKVVERHNIKSDYSEALFLAYDIGKDANINAGTLKSAVPLLRKYGYMRAVNLDMFMAYQKLFLFMHQGGAVKKEMAPFLDELNSAFEIREIPMSVKRENVFLVSSAESLGGVYLLALHSDKNNIHKGYLVFRVDLKKDTLEAEEIFDLPISFSRSGGLFFSANDDFILVYINNKIHVCDMKNRKISSIDFPSKKLVYSLQYVNGRIYILSGPDKNSNGPRELISMLPDGSNIQTHFSSLRDTKISELDNLEGGAFSEIVPLADGKRFLFAVSDITGARINTQQKMVCYSYGNNYSGIYVFDSESDKISLLHKLPPSVEILMARTGGKINVLADTFGNRHYEITEPDLRLDFLLGRAEADKKLFEEGKVKYFLERDRNYPSTWTLFPFIIKDGYLWNAGNFGYHIGGIYCINLAVKEKTPLLYIRIQKCLFAWRDWIVFPYVDSLLAVRIKEKSDIDDLHGNKETRK